MRTMLALAGGAAIIAVAASSGAASSSAPTKWEPPSQSGLDNLRFMATTAGLSNDWVAFLAFVARGESGWNNLSGLGIPDMFPPGTRPNLKASAARQQGEASAARKAWERNGVSRGWFDGCGHDPEGYQFGSGGWFGMIPANGLGVLRKTSMRCLPPSAVFDPAASIVMATAFARGLMGWSQFKELPTVANLRVMWGCPGCGGDRSKIASKRSVFEKHARDTGLNSSFLDKKITRPDLDLEEMYRRMVSTVAESYGEAIAASDYDITADPAFSLMRPKEFYR